MVSDVRSQLRELFSRSKREIDEPLGRISDELEEYEETKDYTEMDLNRWMYRLNELNNRLKKLPMIDIIEDKESVTYVPLIQLRITAEMEGNR